MSKSVQSKRLLTYRGTVLYRLGGRAIFLHTDMTWTEAQDIWSRAIELGIINIQTTIQVVQGGK